MKIWDLRSPKQSLFLLDRNKMLKSKLKKGKEVQGKVLTLDWKEDLIGIGGDSGELEFWKVNVGLGNDE